MTITELEDLFERVKNMTLFRFEEWLESRDNPGWSDGYEVGVQDGKSIESSDRHLAAEEAYDEGYQDGERDGFREGLKKGYDNGWVAYEEFEGH